MTPEPPLDATGIARRKFSTVRKGYDPSEVRACLNELAEVVSRLQREEAHEHERAERAETRAVQAEQLDEHRLVELLGEETARVLDAAREAATDIRTKAEESASRMVRQAQVEARATVEQAERDAAGRRSSLIAEAEALQREAEEEVERRRVEGQVVADDLRRAAEAERDEILAEAERVRVEAAAAGEQIRAAAREQGRRLVGEAQAVRERILGDLARRRRTAREQLERLNGARERLLAAYEVVRRTVDEATHELTVALPEARVASAAAVQRVRDEPDESIEMIEAELSVARMSGQVDPGVSAVSDDELDAMLRELAEEEAARAARRAEEEAGEVGGEAGVSGEDGAGEDGAGDDGTAGDGDDVARGEAEDGESNGGDDGDAAAAPGEGIPGEGADATSPDETTRTSPADAPSGRAASAGTPSGIVADDTGAADTPATGAARPATRPADAPAPGAAVPAGAPGRAEPEGAVAGAVAAPPAAGPASAPPDQTSRPVSRPTPGGRPQSDAERWGVRLPRRSRGARRRERHAAVPPASSPAGREGDAPAVDTSVADAPATAAAEDEGETGPYVDELFARIRAERVGEADDADEADGDTDADADTEPESEPLDPVARTLRARDDMLAGVERRMGRRLKRVLADEQNEVLDTLRRGGTVEFADVLPVDDEHVDRYAVVVGPDLDKAAGHGASAAGGSATSSCDALAGALGRTLVAPLRERVRRSFDDADGDLEEVGERLRAVYREWKGHRIGPAVRHYTSEAYSVGMADAVPNGAAQRWLVDPSCEHCPDCDDNALAGEVSAGDPFPTGDTRAPAHADCRCLVVAASVLADE